LKVLENTELRTPEHMRDEETRMSRNFMTLYFVPFSNENTR
jgi:hypothetical protein